MVAWQHYPHAAAFVGWFEYGRFYKTAFGWLNEPMILNQTPTTSDACQAGRVYLWTNDQDKMEKIDHVLAQIFPQRQDLHKWIKQN